VWIAVVVAGLARVGVAADPPSKYPREILMIRHAEKPDEKGDPHLTSRGAARAAALPSLFLIPPTFPTKPPTFARPDILFAAKTSGNSSRPIETITPLSRALSDLHIHDKHKDDDFQAVADEIFGSPKIFGGKTILICWHHGKMPKLARAIAGKTKNGDSLQIPDSIDENVFDRIWSITITPQGQAAFVNGAQRLLYGDSAQ
jgi:hypothetical protein